MGPRPLNVLMLLTAVNLIILVNTIACWSSRVNMRILIEPLYLQYVDSTEHLR